MRIKLISAFLMVILSSYGFSVTRLINAQNTSTGSLKGNELFNNLLQEFVSDQGNVDYAGINTHQDKLDQYLNYLKENAPQDGWSKNKQLAYWINLYNASTIKLILNHYPVSSIMDIENGKAWDIKFVKSGDRILSLNQVEHDIIRPQFKEPLIHFALNCAAISCPKLLNEVYNESQLSQQLSNQARYFVNNASKNKITKDNISISKIFEWYKSDFEALNSLVKFIKQYSNQEFNQTANISYLEYNWQLNK